MPTEKPEYTKSQSDDELSEAELDAIAGGVGLPDILDILLSKQRSAAPEFLKQAGGGESEVIAVRIKDVRPGVPEG